MLSWKLGVHFATVECGCQAVCLHVMPKIILAWSNAYVGALYEPRHMFGTFV